MREEREGGGERAGEREGGERGKEEERGGGRKEDERPHGYTSHITNPIANSNTHIMYTLHLKEQQHK